MSFFFFKPRKSIQNDVGNEVRAPSALGYAAEIRPTLKTIHANGPRYLSAIVGNRSSVSAVIAIPLVVE